MYAVEYMWRRPVLRSFHELRYTPDELRLALEVFQCLCWVATLVEAVSPL